jgi:hypothetical protein
VRLRARRDANHAHIRDRLREIPGVQVADTGGLGDGFPDLVASRRGYGIRLLEVKDPEKPPSKRRLTVDEEEFRRKWAEWYVVVETLEDALVALGLAPPRT